MALAPFFSEISKLDYTVDTTIPFLTKLFKEFRDGKDVYDIVQADLVTLAASIYSHNPSYFKVFENDDVLWFL